MADELFTASFGGADGHTKLGAWITLAQAHGGELMSSLTCKVSGEGMMRNHVLVSVTVRVPEAHTDSFRMCAALTGLMHPAKSSVRASFQD